jgi:hypothetical protein
MGATYQRPRPCRPLPPRLTCFNGDPSAWQEPFTLSSIQQLCLQLICSKGEFANEYGCPVEALAV